MTNFLRRLRRATTSSHSASKSREVGPSGNELLGQDRRVVQRHFYPLPATVRYGVAASEERVGVCNFSDKGLCFRGAVRFPIGAAVEITATLPQELGFGGRTVRYLAHVVRVSMQRGEFITATSIYRCETISAPTQPLAAPAKHESKALISARALKARRFSRYTCSSTVQFRMVGEERIVSAGLQNLSLAGCYIQTSEACPQGADLEIVLQSGKTRIYAQGRVKTVEPDHGMAVEFVGELAERLQRLPRFVQVVSTVPQKRQR